MLHREHTALVIIDVQGKLAQLMHKKEVLFKSLKLLIEGIKLMGIPIVWMEQIPSKLGPTVPEISILLSDLKPIEKRVFSCVRNDDFMDRLKELNVHDILLAGIEAHVCVYQTAVDLLDQDYHVEVVADAVASRTDFNKQMGLDRMMLEGALQTSVEMALFELQGVAEGDQFRALIKLVK